MRFLMVHRLDESAPEAWNPSPEFIERMGAKIQDWTDRGILITAEGVHPSATGALIRKGDAKISVTDGPFTETKELIAGYWILQCKDMDEALSWARRIPFDDGEVELRPFAEPEDFEGVASPEAIAQEKAWREEQIAKAPKAGA